MLSDGYSSCGGNIDLSGVVASRGNVLIIWEGVPVRWLLSLLALGVGLIFLHDNHGVLQIVLDYMWRGCSSLSNVRLSTIGSTIMSVVGRTASVTVNELVHMLSVLILIKVIILVT